MHLYTNGGDRLNNSCYIMIINNNLKNYNSEKAINL